MKAPSDLRLSAITILIAAGIGLLFFPEPPGGWVLAPIPFFAGIGAIFPKPKLSAAIGAVIGIIAAVFVSRFIIALFSGL
jgi:hypothetical protein